MTLKEDIERATGLAEELGEALPALEKGAWAVAEDASATLAGALGRLGSNEWTGLADTTRGAITVRTATAKGLRSTGGDAVEADTVYEVRLWCPCGGPEPGVLAHELRWLNGSGCAEIRVYDTLATAPGAVRARADEGAPLEDCWYRRSAYLQHRGAGRADEIAEMTALEVFTEEPAYGNTVFVDELFTGKWA